MARQKIIEHAFFFGLLGLVAYIVWLIIFPFLAALILAGIIAILCQPLYVRILKQVPHANGSFASFIATLLVFLMIVTPLSLVGYLMFVEAASFYSALSSGKTLAFAPSLEYADNLIHRVAPDFSLDVTKYAQEAAGWFATSIGSLFASTASAILLLFIAFIALYYLFKDGASVVRLLVYLSPLPDSADQKIVSHIAQAVRSVVTGTLLVSIIQGSLVTIGFLLFGVPQAILWGSVAALAALIPAVGTSLVLVPAVIFLFLSGSYGAAVGILLWGITIVGLVDNVLGPHLLGRGTSLHPLLVLISVLGGMSLFGPIGFVLGPVLMSFFIALLEIYKTYMVEQT